MKTTIKIVEHSGKVHVTEVENYSVEEVFMKIENALSGKFLVLIGGVVIDARSINSITIVEPEEETSNN